MHNLKSICNSVSMYILIPQLYIYTYIYVYIYHLAQVRGQGCSAKESRGR